jgi:hypothetical protein
MGVPLFGQEHVDRYRETDGEEGHDWKYAYRVEPSPDGGWRTFGGAGGAGTLSGRATQPGVSLGGGGWPDHFYAGGEIYRAGADIAQVELRFANGVTLSDDIDADVALFTLRARCSCRRLRCCLRGGVQGHDELHRGRARPSRR